eukprot:TRINITY_DN28423_c0_g1_i1.p1 TRINITY_DN28423_c0_g1~~TRINITY_DN28423_c0_g1_i1.p1  ORF type:complete len:682 (+),score=184.77 TRINITY_DN28423_c0_g1_i1:42-2048(+)
MAPAPPLAADAGGLSVTVSPRARATPVPPTAAAAARAGRMSRIMDAVAALPRPPGLREEQVASVLASVARRVDTAPSLQVEWASQKARNLTTPRPPPAPSPFTPSPSQTPNTLNQVDVSVFGARVGRRGDDGSDCEGMFTRLIAHRRTLPRKQNSGRTLYLEKVLGLRSRGTAAATPTFAEPPPSDPRPALPPPPPSRPPSQGQRAVLRRRSCGPMVVTSVVPLPPDAEPAERPPPSSAGAARWRRPTSAATARPTSVATDWAAPKGVPLPRKRPKSASRCGRARSGWETPEEIDGPPPRPCDARVGTLYDYCAEEQTWASRQVTCTVDEAACRDLRSMGRTVHCFERLDGASDEKAPAGGAMASELFAERFRPGDDSDSDDSRDEPGRLQRRSYFVDVAVYTVAATYAAEWNARCPSAPVVFTKASVLDLPPGAALAAGCLDSGSSGGDGRCLRVDTPNPYRTRNVRAGGYELVLGRREPDNSFSFEEHRRPGGLAKPPGSSHLWSPPPSPWTGALLDQERVLAERMEAFSHFTFCLSRHQLLVLVNKFCNEAVLETSVCLSDTGSGHIVADDGGGSSWEAARHEARALPGRRRMADWLRYHRCTSVCKAMRLPAVPFFADSVVRRSPRRQSRVPSSAGAPSTGAPSAPRTAAASADCRSPRAPACG